MGPFYPRGMKPADFLSYYATQFGVVEADVTYYRVPGPDLVRGWASKVPAGFQICAKFPEYGWRYGVGRAVGTIQDNAKTREIEEPGR